MQFFSARSLRPWRPWRERLLAVSVLGYWLLGVECWVLDIEILYSTLRGMGRRVDGNERVFSWLTLRGMTGMQKTANHLRGFTLIELLVVVVLIGVLFAVALPMFENAGRKDTEKAAFQLISTLRLARQYAISKRQWTLVVFPNKDGGPYNGVGGNNLDKCMRSYAVIAVTNNMDRLDRKDQTPDNMKFSFVSDWKYLPEGMYFDDTWEPGGTATNGNWIFRYRVPDVYKYPYDPARPNDQNASRPMSVLMFKPNGRQFTAREDGIAGGTFWRDDPNSKIYISSAKYYEKTATGLTDPPQVLPGGTNTVLMLNNKTGQVNIWDGQN